MKSLILLTLTAFTSSTLTKNALSSFPETLPFLAVTGGSKSIVIPASNTTSSNTTCATGVHMIVARASTEKPGQGIIGAVATNVQAQVPGSDSEAVDYPATLTDYLNSEASGVAAMTKLIESYASRCPNSKMALLGYSQGAQVVGDVMCGTSEASFNSTKAISAAATKNVVAIIQMGDPSHMVNQPQDVGNSTKNGIFPRNNTATACKSIQKITQSYCNSDDRFCDSGNSTAVHTAYVQGFGTAATKFIVDMVGGKGNSTSSSSSSSGNGTSSSSGTNSTSSGSNSSSSGSNSTSSGTNSTSSSPKPKSDAKGFEGVPWRLVGSAFLLMFML